MTMKTSLAVAVSLALLAGTAAAEFKDMTVNGAVITKAQQERLAASTMTMGHNPHAMQDPGFEDNVRQMLIEAKVMADYAKKQGLDKDSDVQDEIAMQTNMILMNRAIGNFLKANPVKEDEIKAEYDKEKAKYGDKEVRIRVIALKDKVEGAVVLKSLEKGEDFAKLATEKSLDEESKMQGGILDWMSPSQFSKDLRAAVANLKKGETVKELIPAQGGFLIVKLEDTRAAQGFPKYEEFKNNIQHQLMNRKVKAFVNEQVITADVKK